jgi:hypothetical protein
VTKVDDNNFTTAGTYTATGTGLTYRGAYLKVGVGAAGTYLVSYHVTGIQTSGGTGRLFKFKAVQNTTDLDNIAGEQTLSSSTYQQLAAQGIATLAVGDQLWLQMMNRGGTEDYSLRHLNMTAIRIK